MVYGAAPLAGGRPDDQVRVVASAGEAVAGLLAPAEDDELVGRVENLVHAAAGFHVVSFRRWLDEIIIPTLEKNTRGSAFHSDVAGFLARE